MGIHIPREYISKHSKWDSDIEIETWFNIAPKCSLDIIGINGKKFEMEWEHQCELQYDLYNAYVDMVETKRRDKLLNYDVIIDNGFAKRFLYQECIDKYGIIDNIIEVKVNKNNIYVKYEMQGEIEEYIFKDYGFELLKEYRLYN